MVDCSDQRWTGRIVESSREIGAKSAWEVRFVKVRRPQRTCFDEVTFRFALTKLVPTGKEEAFPSP
jgi:hypothetical protein